MQPAVLWNDIAWPTGEARLYICSRTTTAPFPTAWSTTAGAPRRRRLAAAVRAARDALDQRFKAAIAANPAAFEGVIPAPGPSQRLPYARIRRFPDTQAKKWEATRGMSHSFGFNRNDTEADYASAQTLIADFIDGVSKNGNLL